MISVVIPCRNGVELLATQLDALLQQKTDVNFEVIVADNASRDGTDELVRRHSLSDSRLRLVDASRKTGINVARNVGASAARGAFLLFCDADDEVHPGWLDAYARAADAGAACVGGVLHPILPDGLVISQQRTLMQLPGWDLASPVGANCGVRRDVFEDLGGFDESITGGCDEIDFFWRAQLRGFPTTLVSDAVVNYRLRGPLVQVFRQHVAYGRGEVLLYRKYRTHGMPRARGRSLLLATTAALIAVVAGRGPLRLRLRRAAEMTGTLIGRLEESFASRTLYL